MSLFGKFIKDIISSATSTNVSPYSVEDVKSMQYERHEPIVIEENFRLYNVARHQEGILFTSNNRAFSLFRISDMSEARATFKSISDRLLPLTAGCSGLLQKDTLQRICDACRSNPSWLSVHVAAHLGLLNCFKYNVIMRQINAQDPVTGVTPIQVAVLGRQLVCVQELLSLNAQLDLTDTCGNNVLHFAAQIDPKIIQFVAAKQQNIINNINKSGETPLHIACMSNQGECVELLLRWGADPRINASYRFPIHCALKGNNLKCADILFRWCPSVLQLQDPKYGGTALHWAKSPEAVYMLFDRGCDVEAKNRNGETALHIMIKRNRLPCVMALLTRNANADVIGQYENTSLHMAISTNDIDLVRALVVFGAKVDVQNAKRQTPRHLAANSSGTNKDIILNILHQIGAKRCVGNMGGCLPGCHFQGSFDGYPQGKYFNSDAKKQLYDDLIGAAAIAAALSQTTKTLGTDFDVTDSPIMESQAPGHRLLCLDGGGIRGLVLIQLLMAIEEMAGVPLKNCFDWIAGTSTGGILALALVHGKSVHYTQGLYFRLKDLVFCGKRPYPSEPLENFLKKEFGEHTKMNEVTYPKVMVTGVLGDRHPAELHLFRNYDPPLMNYDNKVNNQSSCKFNPPPLPKDQLVWRAARCSGAAPTYFRACGRVLDGGLVANNPTLDALTEIHEYNTAARARGDGHLVLPVGCVVSLGTGKIPQTKVDNVDVFRPEGLMDIARNAFGISALGNLLVDQATNAEGRPVDRARAWCGMLNIPYFRFSPPLSMDVPLDCSDNATLLRILWETKVYIYNNRDKIKQLAQILTG